MSRKAMSEWKHETLLDNEFKQKLKEIEDMDRRLAAESADWQRKALDHTVWVGPECLTKRR